MKGIIMKAKASTHKSRIHEVHQIDQRFRENQNRMWVLLFNNISFQTKRNTKRTHTKTYQNIMNPIQEKHITTTADPPPQH
jgi:hypothetical protein